MYMPSVSDVAYVLENDAEGIGLFRSEFLYLGRDSLPDETEQFNAYRQVLQMMAGKKVIIRTLDIGADKNVDYLGLGKEDNPAMGQEKLQQSKVRIGGNYNRKRFPYKKICKRH